MARISKTSARATGAKVKAVLSVVVGVLVAATLIWSFIDGELGSDGTSSPDTKSHACTHDAIDATVAQDGSLHVVDARSYTFEGSYTLTAAVLDPPSGGQVIVHGVSVTDENGATQVLEEVPFEKKWRHSGGPESGHYAIDAERNTVYAFSATSDASKTFTFDYTYTNAIERYSDVGILYWKFVGPEWDVSTNDVNLQLHLPVPAGQSVEGGKNVYAFGHGELDGTVSFEDSGVIEYAVARVKSGDFAEMRVAFPASWVPDVAPSCVKSGDGLPGMLDEERQWQQEAMMQRIISILMLVIPLAISLACIIIAIVMFLRYGREYKPQFDGDYWRDVPEKGTNPAVIGRLIRWDAENANDLVAVLMQLSKRGVISIDRESVLEDRMILPDKERMVYRLTVNPVKREQMTESGELDKIEMEALAFVFDTIAAGEVSLTLDNIEAYAEGHAQGYVDALAKWQGVVSSEVAKRDFFEAKGESLKARFILVAILLVIAGVLVVYFTANYLPLLGLLPGAVTLFALSFFMSRRSREAVEIQARADALKRWFKDFTNLKEAVPTDAKVWGELLVYAYLFGVMDQVVAGLNNVAPDVWDDPSFMGSMWWYYNPYGVGSRMAAGSGEFFGRAFDNTLTSAREIISSANSGSGGGFGGFGGGGGFSGGGGGGFGGGAGGFSR